MSRISKTLKRVFRFVIPVIAVIGIVTAFVVCIFLLRADVRAEIKQNLADVSEQTASAIEIKIEDNYGLLCGIEQELVDMPGDMRDNIRVFHPFVQAYGLVRLGYCDENGFAYSSAGGAPVNLDWRDFFRRGMEGYCTITNILEDAMSAEKEPINIMSKPMYKNGEIIGVIGLTYHAQKFNAGLQFLSFNGIGHTNAINESGQVIVDTDAPEEHLSKDFFKNILDDSSENAEDIVKLKAMHKDGDECYGEIFIGGESLTYHCKTIELLDGDVRWRVITTVPTDYMNERSRSVDINLIVLLVILIVIIAASFAGVTLLTRSQRATVNRLAYVDALTGGNNYAMFKKKLDETKARDGAFASMDIVEFSAINVAVGRDAGDNVLRAIYATLAQNLTPDDCLGHIGHDTFCMFIKGGSSEEISERVEKLAAEVAALSEKLNVPTLKPKFGLYCAASNTNVDDSYGKARQARMGLRTKTNSIYEYYMSEDNQRLLYNHALIDSFDEAIRNREFYMVYQPKFSSQTRKIVGAEALVRWNRKGEFISPGTFIPLFEEKGLIHRLDEYIFRTVCEDQKAWIESGKAAVPISINLSRASICYSNVADKYMGMLNEYGIDHKYIQIEVTESSVEGGVDVIKLLRQFHTVGIKILIDDFGTGYSSLAMLSTDGFDVLKIDKSLVDNIEDEKGRLLIKHVILMAKSLDMHVTAEGVENEEQFNFLRELKCDDIQGYYFSKPLAKEDYVKYLEK